METKNLFILYWRRNYIAARNMNRTSSSKLTHSLDGFSTNLGFLCIYYEIFQSKSYENSSNELCGKTDGSTDMTKIISTFLDLW